MSTNSRVMSTNSDVGARVKSVRKAAKLTQEALAARLPDIGLDYYRQLEQGTRRWNIETLSSVADALGCEIGFLLPDYRNNPAWHNPSEDRLMLAIRARDWRAALVALGELAAAEPQPQDADPALNETEVEG